MLSKLSECLRNISKEDATKACDEWKIYREVEVEEKFIYDENDNIKRLDHYWNEVLNRKTATGMLKFPSLTRFLLPL